MSGGEMIGWGNKEEVSPGQGLPDSEGSKKKARDWGSKKGSYRRLWR